MDLKSSLTISTIVLSGIIFSACSGKNTHEPKHETTANKKPHTAQWSYSGSTGPAHWGTLNKNYHACKTGKSQSPVDIRKTRKAKMVRLTFKYKPTTLNVNNNGHTLQLNYATGSTLIVGKSPYKLVQFHFHTPSEHTRNGKHRPMEVHFVHANEKGQLAVVGIFMRLGKKPNSLFSQILEHAPKTIGKNVEKNTLINGKELFPRKMRAYFSYSGSLTTPPCSESVRWFIMKNSVRVSAQQITAFKKFFQHTNRPTQALNSRLINRN